MVATAPAFDPKRDYYSNLIDRNPSLAEKLQPRWNDFIPHQPTPKQMVFLALPHKEAFFGGAAGGGKSDALLMAALQYVDVPGYAAIIFRKTFADLSLPGALMERSHQWLMDTPARWDGMVHEWVFPCPGGGTSKIAFGYLASGMDKYRYQSAEFQFIGFDELTQHYEEDYLYLFSRLRRLRTSPVPLRMRAASNPGGMGHLWVKRRWDIKRVGDIYRGTSPKRAYIPSFIKDNPHLDQEEYAESLSNLDPVTREQLLRGDWGVTADGRFKRGWCKYYSVRGDYVVLGRQGNGRPWHRRDCRFFMTIDPAASEREGPGDETRYRKAASWSVISTWCVTPDGCLLWWDLIRFQKEIPEGINEIHSNFRKHTKYGNQPEFVGIEFNGLGIGVVQILQRRNLPIRDLHPRSADKLVRATDAMVRMEQGKVFLPEDAPWLEACEAELFTWTGHKEEPADQIDTLAYAAMEVSREAALSEGETTMDNLPQHFT